MNLSNKKILITGADGFIGSHLTEMLVEHDAKVNALSFYRKLTKNKRINIQKNPDNPVNPVCPIAPANGTGVQIK